MLSKNIKKILFVINTTFLILFFIGVMLCFFIKINFFIRSKGIIEPVDQILIKTQADGVIGEIFVKEGDKVNKGDPIIELKSLGIDSDKTAILAEYKQTYFLYKNSKELYEKGIVSKKELKEKEKDFQIAVSNKKKLQQYVIKAPASGFIISGQELKLKKGDYLKKGDFIAKVTNLEGFIARTYIAEDKISKIEINQKTNVEIKGLPYYRGVFRGRVIKILPEGIVSDKERLFEVIVLLEKSILPGKYSKRLRIYPMMSADVKIIYSNSTLINFILKEKIGL